MLVEDVDGDLHPAGDHPGGKAAVGVGADAPVEDERDLVGTAGPQIVGHQRLEERPRPAGGVQDQGAGDLDLAHGQLPPVARGPVRLAERQRQPGQPPLKQRLDGGGAKPIAELLQPIRVVAGGEPVGQFGEADPQPPGLLLGPLVAVDPYLHGIGEVAADLDERGAKLLIPHVEVVHADPPVGLGEGELWRPGTIGLAPGAGEHPLELLRDPDRDHPDRPAAWAASR